jgi:tetratricopeptide (TPR) repeat protein
MVEDNTEQPNEEFTRIEPASINLTTSSSTQSPAKSLNTLKHSPLVWLGLGVVLTSALGVVFLLPQWVGSKANSTEPVSVSAPAVTSTVTAAPRPANKNKISPWEKAQESQLRQETQHILSDMLETEKALSERGVLIWAGQDYKRAMQYAEAGDELYNERDFASSKKEYEQALSIFSRLIEEMDVIYETTMEKGMQALLDGNSKMAKEAFDLALAMDAIDRAALEGQQRAETLDEVLVMMNNANDLLEKGEFKEARQGYENVLEVDTHYQLARKQIEVTDQMILDSKFNTHMSLGFTAMQERRFSKARDAFSAALKLKPRAVEARSALEQTRHKLTTISIGSLLASAKKYEAEEKWDSALEKYRSALKLDSSLAEAQQGEKFSSLRSKLNARLEQIISQPTRLYDPKVFMETVKFKTKLRDLSEPGLVLTKQLVSIDKLLSKADRPVEVSMQSDNMTSVTLRKVGELGLFIDKRLSLRPGKYVAVGIRQGYRDVRVEFMIDPDKPLRTITVQAAEKIALSR